MQQVSPHVHPAPTIGLGPTATTEQSQGWFDRAKTVLAGGVSSSARSVTTGPLDIRSTWPAAGAATSGTSTGTSSSTT